MKPEVSALRSCHQTSTKESSNYQRISRPDQTRANQRSTKQCNNNDVPVQEIDNQPTEFVFATIEDSGKIYTDQTGRFPTTSILGHKYVMILYDYDSNAIMAKPIKNCTGTEILRACTKLTLELTTKGFKPKIHWLDNKASQALKTFNMTQQIDYQLTPPHIHRQNAAERVIRTWKNHFIAGLNSTDDHFPMHLWCQLIHQAATTTLNMLRPSRRNPKLLAYTILYGVFDFNQTPMAPPGVKVQVHEKSHQCAVGRHILE